MELNKENNSSNTKSFNGKLNDLGTKAKDFITEEKESLTKIGEKTIKDVETVAADAFKKIGDEVSDLASNTLSFIRKNPAIAIAAAVTIGLVVAKFATRAKTDSKSMTH